MPDRAALTTGASSDIGLAIADLLGSHERVVVVEVTVPAAYAPEVNPLVDLAPAIKTHVPTASSESGVVRENRGLHPVGNAELQQHP